MDFVESCRTLISIDTTSDQGNRRAVHWLADKARRLGFFVEIQEDLQGELEQANLFLRAFPDRPQKEILFQSRLDTASPGPFALWKHNEQNPFDAHIIDGRIFGLGAAQCKLDFLCKLDAFKKWKSLRDRSSCACPPVLLGTYGAESGMMGALRVIRKNKIHASFAVIGEPSNLHILTSGKGCATVQMSLPFEPDELRFREEHNLRESTSTLSKTFHGKAAHASTPGLGESAIKKMLEYLRQLPQDICVMEVEGGVDSNSVPAHAFLEIDPVSGFRFSMAQKLNRIFEAVNDLEQQFLQYSDPLFDPPHPTLNLGVIRTFENFVSIGGDVRVPASIPNEVYEEWMKEMRKVCEKLRAQFHVSHYKRPYQTSSDSMFAQSAVDILTQLGGSPEVGTHSTTNEASLFSRVGMECISFGPGQREGNIHTPAENVRIEDLKMAREFYFRLMERFCS